MNRTQLAAIPDAAVARSAAIERGIADSVAYLGSDEALRSLAIDLYWPKWHSPWWHVLLLFELGEVRQVPARTFAAMVEAIRVFPVKLFPIHPGDAPADIDPSRDVLCHCALGSLVQMLAPAVDVEAEPALGFVVPWFERYQMADGGLSCDDQAYLAAERTGECPSSMVGTVAPFEAMLRHAARADRTRDFIERGARFLIDRALIRGSASTHNADERRAAESWPLPCFPRFYFYDVLRGVTALVRWAEQTGARVPRAALADAVDGLIARFPDGVVHVGRREWDDCTTMLPTLERPSARPARVPATTFPLLDAVSVIGEPSEALTRQWTATRHGLLRLIDAGQLGD